MEKSRNTSIIKEQIKQRWFQDIITRRTLWGFFVGTDHNIYWGNNLRIIKSARLNESDKLLD